MWSYRLSSRAKSAVSGTTMSSVRAFESRIIPSTFSTYGVGKTITSHALVQYPYSPLRTPPLTFTALANNAPYGCRSRRIASLRCFSGTPPFFILFSAILRLGSLGIHGWMGDLDDNWRLSFLPPKILSVRDQEKPTEIQLVCACDWIAIMGRFRKYFW